MNQAKTPGTQENCKQSKITANPAEATADQRWALRTRRVRGVLPKAGAVIVVTLSFCAEHLRYQKAFWSEPNSLLFRQSNFHEESPVYHRARLCDHVCRCTEESCSCHYPKEAIVRRCLRRM